MITIKEMAEIAGVSPTTVANVLHGRNQKVSKETLEKVQNVISQSNYVSNMGARMLGNYGSKIIAVILSYEYRGRTNLMQDPFAGSIIGAIEQEVSRHGYFMMFYTNPNVEECLHMALAWNIEGLILLGINREEYYLFRSRLDIPIVTIDTYFHKSDREYVNVGLQDYEGGFAMTEYLIKQGHSKIAFLSPVPSEGQIDDARFIGYCDALQKHQIHINAKAHIVLQMDARSREQALTELAGNHFEGYTALFFSADCLAIEAMNVFYDLGYRIPQDISITGFDNIPASMQCRPRLTTIQQDIQEKGKKSVEQVMTLIQNRKKGYTDNFRLPVQLIVRDTVKKIL